MCVEKSHIKDGNTLKTDTLLIPTIFYSGITRIYYFLTTMIKLMTVRLLNC